MKYQRVFITTALVLLLAACGNESTINSTLAKESSTAEQIDIKQDADKAQAEELTSTQEQQNTISIEQFSQDIGSLSGHELSNRIVAFSHKVFDQGFQSGFVQEEPAYPVAELSDQLTKFEKHVTDSLQSESKDQPTSSPYNAQEFINQLSYGLGYIRGSQLVQFAPDIDITAFINSFSIAYNTPDQIDIEVVRDRVKRYVQASEQKAAEKREGESVGNLEKSQQFLAENKGKDGIVTTESGLQYEVLTQGDGDSPKATDTVEVHYEGRLLDDSIFDSSYKRNQTATFPLNGVIAGWTEGLQYMFVGSKYRFFIPPALGYGVRGSGNSIGANELLIFDVELISIQ